ncbi:MAG: ABC transporter ATP-binding protein [Gammaproteobacteria bacterium]|nr:ABC transporter ATP-binding protein [Gammaproteobacteria bacterium]MDE0411716.1 ABC transporter ATP-binding protein [Gammaproteobacteria bacterium]
MTVEVDGIRFAWKPGQRDVVDIECFQVSAGERVFIEGPSGSGKSTLFSLLGGVVSPREGTVRILQTNLSRMPAHRRDLFRADHIGFVFQMFNLVPYLSMLDNVTLPCRFSLLRRKRVRSRAESPEAEARRLLDRLGLNQHELHGRPVTDLSIGQQQRVAIARALIGAPELIMADEPTSSLDEGTRERFLEVLTAQCDEMGASLLFASHDMRLSSMFDRRVSLIELNRAAPGQPREPT